MILAACALHINHMLSYCYHVLILFMHLFDVSSWISYACMHMAINKDYYLSPNPNA